MTLSRREFGQRALRMASALAISPALAQTILGQTARADDACPYPGCVEAWRYDKLPGNTVQCRVCPRGCRLAHGEISHCKAKQNFNGTLYSLSYGQVSTIHLDPIEKGPFYHVEPGKKSLAIGPAGCNLHCLYCQNWQISQTGPLATKNSDLSPRKAVTGAREKKLAAITFTYTEPVTYPRYLMDVCRAAKKEGLLTNMVTAGYVLPEALKEMSAHVDAFTITLKGWRPSFYREVAKAEIEPVKKAIQQVGRSGKWAEIVTLLVPGQNDDEETARGVANFVKNELGPDTPLHFLRFLPAYQLRNLPPTPVAAMDRARKIAMDAGLRYVYLGNVPGHAGQNTL